MNKCDAIHEKLASDEALEAAEHEHLLACEDCKSYQATIELISAGAQAISASSEPTEADVRSVQEYVARRTRPARVGFRLAWASAALLVGIGLAVAVLSNVFGTDNLDQSEEKLFSLLDEVSEIADPFQDSSLEAEEESGLFVAEVLLEDDSKIDTELPLPDSYLFLEEALENDWL